MKTKGFTRNELILTVVGLVVLVGLLIYAVVDTRRRARDTERLSVLRQIEFDLLEYRSDHASFPDSLETLYEGAGIPGYAYTAEPVGCRADAATLCSSYRIAFSLEGRVGTLSGGACESSPDGIACLSE